MTTKNDDVGQAREIVYNEKNERRSLHNDRKKETIADEENGMNP